MTNSPQQNKKVPQSKFDICNTIISKTTKAHHKFAKRGILKQFLRPRSSFVKRLVFVDNENLNMDCRKLVALILCNNQSTYVYMFWAEKEDNAAKDISIFTNYKKKKLISSHPIQEIRTCVIPKKGALTQLAKQIDASLQLMGLPLPTK